MGHIKVYFHAFVGPVLSVFPTGFFACFYLNYLKVVAIVTPFIQRSRIIFDFNSFGCKMVQYMSKARVTKRGCSQSM